MLLMCFSTVPSVTQIRQRDCGLVLPARLPRFWLDTGVGSGAWVPAWPPNRLTPSGLSCETICRPGPRFTAPAGAAGLICPAWT